MCKKVVFLVWLACLLVPASSVFSADLEIAWPPPFPGWCYVVSGTEEYCEINVSGCIIVPAGATLIMNCESCLDGNWDDGEGGEGATILVDGGTFIMRGRLNMGCDHDAYLIIDNGGTVIHTGDKVTIPDNDGGEHRLIVLDGTYTSEETEIIPDRDAKAIVGCAGTLTTCNTDEDDSRRPSWWVTADCSGGGKALECEESCAAAGGVLIITPLPGGCEEAICFLSTCYAYGPKPKNGATGVGAVTCDLVLSWKEGNCLGLKGRNFIYFGDCDCVTNTPSPPEAGYNDPACYKGYQYAGNTTYNVGMLPLWTTYCWRIDQGCADASVCRGEVWTFTTGCSMLAGDANLDCVVNFLDYAAVASTWLDEHYFPEGCTP
jgi:hypothetical protein